MNMDELVDRFLSWPLPDSVCSDLCATKQGYPSRSGTNLLTAVEARQMLEYLLGDKVDDAYQGWQTDEYPPCDEPLLGLFEDGTYLVVVKCPVNGWQYAETREELNISPTHWMTLPAPPAEQGGRE